MVARLFIGALITVNTVTVAPKRLIIKETGMADAWVCADYTAPAAPRVASRACLSAAQVRDFILRGGTPSECE